LTFRQHYNKDGGSNFRPKSRELCNGRPQSKHQLWFFFHSSTVHLDTIKIFYLPTDAQ